MKGQKVRDLNGIKKETNVKHRIVITWFMWTSFLFLSFLPTK